MRVAADEFFGDRLHHVSKIESALFLRHPRVEYDLQQKIAQFVTQIAEIAARDRVRHLVGLFERIGGDGREILLEIPRAAAAWRAQRRHDFEEPGDVAGRDHGAGAKSEDGKGAAKG